MVSGGGADHRQSATTTRQGAEFPARPETPSIDSADHLLLGEYRILETSPPGTPADGWSLTGVTCNGPQVPFAQGGLVVHLTRSHPHQHCVFTNTFTRRPPPPPDPDPGPDDKPAQQRADLAVTKHPSARVATRGDTVAFRLTVINHGPDHATRVVLRDQLFGSAVLVSIHTDTGHCAHGLPAVCELGTLSPHAKAHVTVRLRMTSSSSHFADRVVVGSATQDPNLANNVASASVRVVRPPAHRPRHRRHKPRFTG